MSPSIEKRILSLLVVVFILQSCGSSPLPPSWEKCDDSTAETEKKLPETSNYLLVYLDTSASMSGYIAEKEKHTFAVSPDSETVYSKTLLELRTVLSSLNPQPEILLRSVSDEVGDSVKDDLAISRASFTRTIYNGQETNLAGAFSSFAEPVKMSADKRMARVHILVTDAVQSSAKQNENTACENGSDWRCVKKQLSKLLNDGWGGSILGIKSEFQGNIFSEIKKEKIAYDSVKNGDKFRPFYLYILAPVPADAEKITESLRKRLGEIARENNLTPGKLFREYPLTANLAEKKLTAGAEVEASDAPFLEILQDESGDARFDAKVSIKTETEGSKSFSVKVKVTWTGHALDMDTPENLVKLIKWKIVDVPLPMIENHRYPELKMIGQSAEPDGTLIIRLSVGWHNEIGTPDWRMYRIIGTLDRTSVPTWVRDWSTKDDTLQINGHKTLNLESSFANLWETASPNDYKIAEVCLRVGNK